MPQNNLIAQDFNFIQNIAGEPFQFTSSTLGQFLYNSKLLDYIFGIAAFLLLIYLVMGGFQMMTSQGDPKAMQMAQAKITNALIGFLIIIFAIVIVSVIGEILGITVFGSLF